MATSLSDQTCLEKFHSERDIVITAKQEITPEDVQEYLAYKIRNHHFADNTTFWVLSGFNMMKSKDGKFVFSQTDFNLIQGFGGQVFEGLRSLQNEEKGTSFWEEKNFQKKVIPIACTETLSLKPPFTSEFELSDLSKADLKGLAKKVLDQATPHVVIIAASYSHHSSIRKFFNLDNSKMKRAFNKGKFKPRGFEKFHCESNFITTNNTINAQEVQDYLAYRIKNGDFYEDTTFCTIAGIHHGLDQDGQVVLGPTEFALLQGFMHKVFSELRKLKDEKTGKLIWDAMNFNREMIPITCEMNETTEMYELKKDSEEDLKALAKELVNQTKPFVVIFASCFSYHSTIKDFLVENGILATLDITEDRSKFSGGRIFALDSVQKEVLNEFREV